MWKNGGINLSEHRCISLGERYRIEVDGFYQLQGQAILHIRINGLFKK